MTNRGGHTNIAQWVSLSSECRLEVTVDTLRPKETVAFSFRAGKLGILPERCPSLADGARLESV